MGALTINGWEISAADGSIMRESTFRGSRERGKSGQHRDGRRDHKRAWDAVTTVQDLEVADAIQGLVQGLGHVWAYKDGIAASTGAKPTADSDVVFVATGGRYDGHLSIQSAAVISHNVPVGHSWTMMGWVDDGTGQGWQHMALRSDGAEFIDGVSAAGPSGIFVVIDTANLFNLNGVDRTGANAAIQVDELVIVPWFAPDDAIRSFATYALPFSPLPFVDLSGDIVEDPLFVRVRGQKLTGSFVQVGGRALRGTSAWRPNNVETGFQLVERSVEDVRELLPLPVSYWTMAQQ